MDARSATSEGLPLCLNDYDCVLYARTLRLGRSDIWQFEENALLLPVL